MQPHVCLSSSSRPNDNNNNYNKFRIAETDQNYESCSNVNLPLYSSENFVLISHRRFCCCAAGGVSQDQFFFVANLLMAPFHELTPNSIKVHV